MFQLEHSLRAHGTHVLNRVLVTDIVGTLDGVVHVPAPVIIGVGTGDGAGNTALGRYSVGTGRKYLGDTCGIDAGFCQLKGGTHTGTAATDNNRVIRHGLDISH